MKGKMFDYNTNLPIKMPFASKSFDFIHSQQTIEHIPENLIPMVIKEMYRVCKKGAIVYLATVGHSDKPMEERGDPTHVSCFGSGFWHPIFEKVGFKIVTDEYMPSFLQEKFYQNYQWTQYILKK
jgi:ubiquinone/menaquinone biosynthesis C-methylase UbiE